MQSYRALARLPAATRVICPTPTRKMSLWPRSYFAEAPTSSFTPLFRLLDDFDCYSRSTQRPHRNHLKSFNPKFDVKELPQFYELHGELAGVDQNDVELEFTDSQTLSIRGRSNRSYESDTRPAGVVDASDVSATTIVEGGEVNEHKSHQATVEDENAPKETQEAMESEPMSAEAKGAEEKAATEQSRYWVSERSVGEFSRSFSFPVRVDQDSVRASMKNGVLSIVVPKAKKAESRKITIS